jgi:hypothetical protein
VPMSAGVIQQFVDPHHNFQCHPGRRSAMVLVQLGTPLGNLQSTTYADDVVRAWNQHGRGPRGSRGGLAQPRAQVSPPWARTPQVLAVFSDESSPVTPTPEVDIVATAHILELCADGWLSVRHE